MKQNEFKTLAVQLIEFTISQIDKQTAFLQQLNQTKQAVNNDYIQKDDLITIHNTVQWNDDLTPVFSSKQLQEFKEYINNELKQYKK